MKAKKTGHSNCLAMCLIGIALFIFGCGGGGGSSETPAADGSSSMGSVAVFLADAPDEDLTGMFIDITKISLLSPGNGKEKVIFPDTPDSNPILSINLLSYQNGDDFFLTLKDVPAGFYEKIRLEADNIYAEGDGIPCDGENIKLPSNRIDLNPRGGIQVVPGETLKIKLDIDVKKSFQVHEAGNSRKCIFRPVIFVDIEKVLPSKGCPGVIHGTIKDVNLDNDEFVLDLRGQRGTVTVQYNEDEVLIYDENGDTPEDKENVLASSEGLPAEVRGRFTSYGKFFASLIVVGQVVNVKGTVGSAVVDEELTFPFTVETGQALMDTWNVRATPETLVLFSCDQPADFKDIQSGMKAKVIGKVFSDGTIKAIAILLERQTITGRLVHVQASGSIGDYLLHIETSSNDSEDNIVTVSLPAGTPVEFVGDGSVEIELLETLTTCEIHPFVKVAATTNPDGSPDLAAEIVYVVPERLSGTVAEVDPTDQIIKLDTTEGEKVVKVQKQAFIFKCGKYYDLVPLDYIQVGHYVSVFGLADCVDSEFDFLAFVVVIDKWDDDDDDDQDND